MRRAVKAEGLAADLRERITRGEMKPGERLPSLAQMCRKHALSRTTVDRVHRQLERDGLIVREQGRGAFVARSRVVSARTDLIGFAGWGFGEAPRSIYWMHLVEGMREMAACQGKGLLLLDYATGGGWDKVEGVLTSDLTCESWVAGLPRVELMYARTDATSVVANDEQAGKIATEHLLALGHRRIGCIMRVDTQLGKRRVYGHLEALCAAGIKPNPAWVRPFGEVGVTDPEYRQRSRRVMRAWLASDWAALGITAVLANNDLAAMGIVDALTEAGIGVPDDVSVIGFDGTEICDLMSPPLTSVYVPLREIGALGVEALLRQIRMGRTDNSVTMLPTRLRMGSSTRAIFSA